MRGATITAGGGIHMGCGATTTGGGHFILALGIVIVLAAGEAAVKEVFPGAVILRPSIVFGPETVSGANLTITGAGVITVRASQAGNGNYTAAANVDQSFTVSKATASTMITPVSINRLASGTAFMLRIFSR